MVGVEGVDDAEGGVEDEADALVEIRDVAKVEDIHGHNAEMATIGVKETVAEDAGAGVDAKDEHVKC